MAKQPINVEKKQSLKESAANWYKEGRAASAERAPVEIKATLQAMVRQGAAEMGQALKAFPDSIGPQETTGTVGNPTQQQISASFGLYGKNASAPSAAASVYGKANEPTVNQEKELEPDYEP